MQSVRFFIFLLSCMLVLSILLFCRPASSFGSQDIRHSHGVGAYLNWRTPSSLFPPSAIISLTDDNSTFFLARPAAFGPDLPSRSLSGQLWIGSGFGDDHVGRNGPGGRLEGELGCSDVPGWSETESYSSTSRSIRNKSLKVESTNHRRADSATDNTSRTKWSLKSSANDLDGTDDDLSPAKAGQATKNHAASLGSGRSKSPAHADIQSLQESAEISGKVALLSRGGCGFLDKVEWEQRRGAVAVIIGDDVSGGPLVTMYARGDTSNISIPALFTSHTTAHLLSSLMPSGARQRFLGPKSGIRPPSTAVSSKTSAKEQAKTDDSKIADVEDEGSHTRATEGGGGSGWFWALFGTEDVYGRPTTNRKPLNTGDMDWVLQTEFDEADSVGLSYSASQVPNSKPTDGFVIGVHDWRDPDLVGTSKRKKRKPISPEVEEAQEMAHASVASRGEPAVKSAKGTTKSSKVRKVSKPKANGWLNSLVHTAKEPKPALSGYRVDPRIIDPDQPVSNPVHLHDIHIPGAMEDQPTEHEGLWVTLTATSISSSPFFDTLLVLVVSPLVTLTVVYALLLLRSRIRRRRWRAPKSVVERLPVRTYQTMSSAPVSSTTSSISPPASMHTPLLSTAARPIVHRPRSRTDLDMPSTSGSQSLDPAEEKREAGLAEWRRKYGGKQKECVVCLEEYIDGISRVMSLPCGHEFHEGCITPWLTTRRRTCPICKGDVVRSLARSAGSTSSALASRTEEEGDIQEQVVLLTNDDPNSLRPISRDSEEFEDLERGFAQRSR